REKVRLEMCFYPLWGKALKCLEVVEKSRTIDKKKSSDSFGLATVPKHNRGFVFLWEDYIIKKIMSSLKI
ncbi:TPA: hypothetical protein ACITC9_004456, partial [Salmonella enterica subsp. enterica serovar Enteritidis]